MKITIPLLLSVMCATAAQIGPPPGETQTNPLEPTAIPATIIERGEHHRVFQRIAAVTNSLGQLRYRTNGGYTELQTSMHHLVGSNWVESSEAISLTTGGAAATNCSHQCFFAADASAADGMARLVTPDGKTLTTRLLGLAYADPISGSNTLIAELQSSIGQLVSDTQVRYPNALTGDCSADIIFQNYKAGLEQNIVIRTRPPPPSEYGFSEASTIQVWTEFIGNAEPGFAPNSTDADVQIDFGPMNIWPG